MMEMKVSLKCWNTDRNKRKEHVLNDLKPLTPRVFNQDDVICFCFGHTRRGIEEDCSAHGQSAILLSIMDDKKAGRCECAVKNPKGR